MHTCSRRSIAVLRYPSLWYQRSQWACVAAVYAVETLVQGARCVCMYVIQLPAQFKHLTTSFSECERRTTIQLSSCPARAKATAWHRGIVPWHRGSVRSGRWCNVCTRRRWTVAASAKLGGVATMIPTQPTATAERRLHVGSKHHADQRGDGVADEYAERGLQAARRRDELVSMEAVAVGP